MAKWIYQAQDREKWHAVVIKVMNPLIPEYAGKFLTI